MAKRPFVGAVCLAMLLSNSTWAATIEPGQGNLTINQGQGFQPVNSRIDANVGDSVMVGPDGSATVVYDDGCKVAVQPGAVTTIAPLSPCASGSFAADMGVPVGAPPPPPFDPGAPIMGGIVAGLTGYVIYRALQPASP
jgi:hypothetical protein